MKRMHIHISVDDLEPAKRFYAALFSAEPIVEKSDYAKWILEDPRVNLALSTQSGDKPGLNHVGIQTETEDELADLSTRLNDARIAVEDEKGANCCYAQSDKHWTADPTGLIWEIFHTMGESVVYGDDHGPTQKTDTKTGAKNGTVQSSPETSAGCCA